MTFTRRFFWLVGLAALPLLLTGVFPMIALLVVIWNIALVAVALIDYVLCPRAETAIAAERITDDVLSVAASNQIVVRLRNATQGRFSAIVRDEPPAQFALDPETPRQRSYVFAPFAVHTLEYNVTPPARGDFAFGDVYARITGPLGLIIRQGRIDAARTASVYRNLRAVEDYDLMLRRAHQSRQGARRIRITGGGREFSSLREYTPDDEYRVIDWKATARRGKVISRTYEAERSQDVLLLIDLGRLMRQEIAHTQKLDHVINASLMLAHVVAEADDRVGLLTFADEPRAWLTPRRGRAQAGAILEALYAARAEPLESDYRAAFRFLATTWRKRSLAVLFTDLADPESSAMLLKEIAQLAASHLVVCVVVSDPLIGERARRSPDTAEQAYEKAVADEVLSERVRALELLARRGVLVVDAEPKELSAELVARYLAVKSRSMI